MKQRFTLVEMVATLVIFSIFLLMMMGIYQGVERAWQVGAAEQRVLQNARTILDQISDDLRYLALSEVPGAEIDFWVGEDGGNGSAPEAANMGPFPVFVSNVGDTAGETDASSRLAEIHYQIGYFEGGGQRMEDADGKPQLFFKRKEVRSKDSGWDFYKNSTWFDTGDGADFYPIAAGVADIQFRFIRFKRRSGSQWVYDLEEVRRNLTGGRLKAVDVELTLFDAETESLDNNSRTKRTFFKRIYIEQIPL